jgi:hypothetical protein
MALILKGEEEEDVTLATLTDWATISNPARKRRTTKSVDR